MSENKKPRIIMLFDKITDKYIADFSWVSGPPVPAKDTYIEVHGKMYYVERIVFRTAPISSTAHYIMEVTRIDVYVTETWAVERPA